MHIQPLHIYLFTYLNEFHLVCASTQRIYAHTYTLHHIDNNLLNYCRDVSADNYFLLVESLDTEVVAFAPILASSYPRVIAVGEGNGDLLRVTLLLPEDCRAKRNNQFSKQVRDMCVVVVLKLFDSCVCVQFDT